MTRILLLTLLVSLFAQGEVPNPSLNFRKFIEGENQTFVGPAVDGTRMVYFLVKEGKFGFEIRADHRERNPRFVELRNNVRRFALSNDGLGRYFAVVDTPTGLFSSFQKEVGGDEWEAWKRVAEHVVEKKDLHVFDSRNGIVAFYLSQEGKFHMTQDGQHLTIQIKDHEPFKSLRTVIADSATLHVLLAADGKVLVMNGRRGKVIQGMEGIEKITVGENADGRLEIFGLKEGRVYHAFQERAIDWASFTEWRPFGNLRGVTHLTAYDLNRQGVGLVNAEGLYIVAIRNGVWTHVRTFPRNLTQQRVDRDETFDEVNRTWLNP